MGGLSIWHILIVVIVVMVLFGRKGRLSDTMEDLGQGIKAFKKGMRDDHHLDAPPARIETDKDKSGAAKE